MRRVQHLIEEISKNEINAVNCIYSVLSKLQRYYEVSIKLEEMPPRSRWGFAEERDVVTKLEGFYGDDGKATIYLDNEDS